MKQKKVILVTGGAGFIGSNISDALIDQGNDVVVLDNLSTGVREYINKKADFIYADITKKQDIEKIFTKNSFHAVFHLAGSASIVRSFTNPSKVFQTNLDGTINIVNACLKHNVHRLLYASSMTAYGHPKKNPISETTACIPVSYYGISKYAAERFIHATAERNDLQTPFNVTSFRMFNVYGPRQSLTNAYQGAMGIFLGNLLRNEPITIFGDGKQSRDFVYIQDVAAAWIRSLDNEKTYGKVFNVGYGKDISVNDLTRVLIKKMRKKNYPVVYRHGRPGEQRHTISDISLLNKTINWSPRFDLEKGLEKTIQWAKENLHEKTRAT